MTESQWLSPNDWVLVTESQWLSPNDSVPMTESQVTESLLRMQMYESLLLMVKNDQVPAIMILLLGFSKLGS